MPRLSEEIIDDPALRDRRHVFRDRADAGARLAQLLIRHGVNDALVLGIPSGGVPVAVAVAQALEADLDVAVVSKITLPWNTEAGYGAVAFDGTVRLNEQLVERSGLSSEQTRQGIELTRAKVMDRVHLFHRDNGPAAWQGRRVVLVDDGIASGFTFQVAVEAVRRHKVHELIAAVPTAHHAALLRLGTDVDRIFCANVRAGLTFAVADAYVHWRDVDEDEALRLYTKYRGKPAGT